MPKKYITEIISLIKQKNPGEPEFQQAAEEILETLVPAIEKRIEFRDHQILERLIEPERVIMFRVPWFDDAGKARVNRGFRVQFNSAIGPYKGGLRFHPTVNLSVLKFLGFEQTFKNSLTTLPMGGGKGGSDFDPRGKSDAEVMRFCQSFMTELFRHIGADTDVPAGDLGVGGREIGYLFGQYKRLANQFTGVLTGKGLTWGGSLVRPEATGYGVIYFTQQMLRHKGQDIEGKIFGLSGFGQVAWGAAKKITQLGGRVVTISGPDGFVYDESGIRGEKIDFMLNMRSSGHDKVESYAKEFKASFHEGKKPWSVKMDVAIPAATQNELNEYDAEELVKNGCKFVCEAANMPSTREACRVFSHAKTVFAPGKAANAGGVATSGLEMSQNSMRMQWLADEVDARLHEIMVKIHDSCLETSEEFGDSGNYVMGANISGFMKIATAMMDQGVV